MRDSALPMGVQAETISQPYIVARMIELAEIKPSDKVLEVGAGSGYAAAVMSRSRRTRCSPSSATRSWRSSPPPGSSGSATPMPRSSAADGTKGLPEEAPFRAIIVSAGGPHAPEGASSGRAIGGGLIVPVGELGFVSKRKISARWPSYGWMIGEEGWSGTRDVRARRNSDSHGWAANAAHPPTRAV